jgi:hypothetical protein
MSPSKHVLPYRTLPDDFLKATEGWKVQLFANSGPDPKPLSEHLLEDNEPLETWDASSILQLSRTYRQAYAIDEIPGFSGIPSESFNIVLGTVIARGRYRRTVHRAALRTEKDAEYTLTCEVRGEDLAGDLALHVSVVVGSPVPNTDLLSPTMPGCRLWEDSARFHLEGGRALLQIREGDFSKLFPGEGLDEADFHVLLDHDLSQSVEQAMAVYLNTRRTDFLKDVKASSMTPAEHHFQCGVIRRAVTTFLLCEDDETAVGTEGSASHAISAWISQIWPNDSRTDVRDRMKSNSSQVEAQIEAWFRRTTRSAN